MVYQVRQDKALVVQLQARDSLGNAITATSLSARANTTGPAYIVPNGAPGQFVIVSRNPTSSQGVVVNVTGNDNNGNPFGPLPVQFNVQGQSIGQSTLEVSGAPQEIDASTAPSDPGTDVITVPVA